MYQIGKGALVAKLTLNELLAKLSSCKTSAEPSQQAMWNSNESFLASLNLARNVQRVGLV